MFVWKTNRTGFLKAVRNKSCPLNRVSANGASTVESSLMISCQHLLRIYYKWHDAVAFVQGLNWYIVRREIYCIWSSTLLGLLILCWMNATD